MKSVVKIFCSILIFIFCSKNILNAQLKKVDSKTLEVNYTQTVHLVFDTPLKYYNSVSDFVVCDSPKETPHILRIKANQESFDKETTVSVAGDNGKFYSFKVKYKEQLSKTFYTFSNESFSKVDTIYISDISQTHIVFPNRIVYIDYGDESVKATKAENIENILRVQATDKFKAITNVSIATDKGNFYTYNLLYKQNPQITLYSIQGKEQSVILSDSKINSREKEDLLQKIEEKKPSIFYLAKKKNGILFKITNIVSYKNVLVFVISITNKTSIPFDIDYARYSICDKKVGKLTASQDLEKETLFLKGFSKHIGAQKKLKYIVAIEKFSIADDKVFKIEINEKGGGRHILFKLDNAELDKCERIIIE